MAPCPAKILQVVLSAPRVASFCGISLHSASSLPLLHHGSTQPFPPTNQGARCSVYLLRPHGRERFLFLQGFILPRRVLKELLWRVDLPVAFPFVPLYLHAPQRTAHPRRHLQSLAHHRYIAFQHHGQLMPRSCTDLPACEFGY